MHVYVHVPFCARRCSYCDFAIAVRKTVPSDAFVSAVLADWHQELRLAPLADHAVLDTLYFGGGTPSHVAPSAIHRLIDVLQEDRPLAPGAEVTLEVNPDDVTVQAAQAWRQAGVTRISLGVQSFDPAVLHWMHRVHAADAPARAIGQLRDAGFHDISIDLIFALPRGLSRDWQRDLDLGLSLHPTHVSLYGLTIEAGTPLGRWTARGESLAAPDEAYATEYLAAHTAFRSAGFEHYEVSNAGLPGYRARHNSAYWARRPFVGLGPSAHSGAGDRRWWKIREWAAYERTAADAGPLMAGEEHLDSDALRLEALYLGLRTSDGMEMSAIPLRQREQWAELGWAVEREGRLRLTVEGWLRMDALVAAVA